MAFGDVICQLSGPYGKKVWPRAWKCCPRPQAEGRIFKTEVTVFHHMDPSKLVCQPNTDEFILRNFDIKLGGAPSTVRDRYQFCNHMTSQHGGNFKIREFSYSLRFARYLFDYARLIYPRFYLINTRKEGASRVLKMAVWEQTM